MKKVFFLGLFMIFNLVSAQVIYGTKNSFFNSFFCKKYKCKLTDSTFSKKTGLNGGVWYIYYKIKDPESSNDIQVFTHRDKNNVMIPSITIGFQDINISNITEGRNQLLADFVYAIIGKKIKLLDFSSNCTDYLSKGGEYKIMLQGKTVPEPPNKPLSYVLYCQMLGGLDLKNKTDFSINFVISDDYHPR